MFRFAMMTSATVLAVSIWASPVAAQNQVYDPLPPAGSAYVRFVNADAAAVSLKPDFLPAQSLGITPAQRVTSFLVVEKVAGRALVLDLQGAGRTGHVTLHAEPGAYVTVIVQPGKGSALDAVAVSDKSEFNQSRARLSFYNAAPACPQASLAIVPDGPVVFQDVATDAVKTRSVNPVTAQIRTSCADKASAPFALEGLEAGAMFSVWMMGDGVTPTSFLTRDVTAKWKP